MSLDRQPPAGPHCGRRPTSGSPAQAHRREYLPGWRGEAQRRLERVGWWPRLAVARRWPAPPCRCSTGNDFQLQVGINALLLALLAVGLNIAVGWAGLLDLGYIAFYGFGAYGFALLSSNQLGSERHPPAGLRVDPARDGRRGDARGAGRRCPRGG